MAPTAGKEADPPKKKARRSSRHGEVAAPLHYGPIACTSSAAALVQAYLAVDAAAAAVAAPTANGSSEKAVSTSNSRGLRSAGDNCFLHMSESRFDPVKRRFGGRSKPVCLASVGDGAGSRGARVSFGPAVKVVATKEAMHTALHCRCMFVLLCEVWSEGASKSSSSSSSYSAYHEGRRGAAHSTPSSRGKRVDTAHLVALSPDDLFLALSVDSFPLTAAVEADGNSRGGTAGGGGGGGNSASRRGQIPAAAGAFPRAFDVVDGPVVVHRPAARLGEPWRGLEVFRPVGAVRGDATSRPWKGQRVSQPVVVQGLQDGGDGDGSCGVDDGNGGGGSGNGHSFTLDLSAPSAAGDDTPQSGDGPRSKKRAAGNGAGSNLLVCPPCASQSTGAGADFYGAWRSDRRGRECDEYDEGAAAIVALPMAGVSAAAGAAGGTGTVRAISRWASLSFGGEEGHASLLPWRGAPSGWRNSLTCLCRAPDMDAGLVGLAGALPGVGPEGALVLRPVAPTVYVGATGNSEAELGSDGGTEGGSLLELQGGGTLSCCRSLPAPPWAVMTAAVDDAQGVLVVLLADPAGTALLLARDGAEFPVVEEYRGVAAAFAGDFLGNGREQVALLPVISSAPSGNASGGGVAGGRRAAVAAKAGAGGWEQLPLKALVKRALLADCSCVWGNGRRDDLAALPGAGPIQLVGARPNGGGGRDSVGVNGTAAPGGAESANGRKRQRTEGGDADAGKGGKSSSSIPVEQDRRSGAGKSDEGIDDHRLGRLSTVVGVLRRRVRAEEMRLLRLRQARRGKAALLEAAKLALAAGIGDDLGGGSGDYEHDTSERVDSAARMFYDGQMVPGECSVSSPSWIDDGASQESLPPLRCAIARLRFHAPSRTLCLDAHVTNPSHIAGDASERSASEAMSAVPTTVVNVCLSVASASGHLATRSAVCPRLRPGESATVRACVKVPLTLLNGGDGGGSSGGGESAALYASCMWNLDKNVPGTGDTRSAATAGSRDGDYRSTRSTVFARVLVSPQDMLGIGTLSSSGEALLAPNPETTIGTRSSRCTTPGGRRRRTVPTSSDSGDAGGIGDNNVEHLGLFDVGTRIDLLMRSDTASLAALPQAVRSLSTVASLPEPWAGGAAAFVGGCSERAAECTLRADDSTGATAVLLRVAAGALPDGAAASADHASEQGRALVAAAASALRDEMAALEVVARERRGIAGAGAGEDGGGDEETRALAAALERYTSAQMKSDLLAAKLAGRIAAARGAGGTRGVRPR